ncbi:UrcA family protein [Novosphingobium sp. YJ-S2-02]|uniref:UrcA family protein n=1 Tax=Novosphingobium aureum TaxID=2792964 RepID=A0A931H8M7_9SPHN|nr:UrcA family protein [Novosphingobium aureum]MBH0111361.1 UrcA family protein [Novosphingobium aureum]
MFKKTAPLAAAMFGLIATAGIAAPAQAQEKMLVDYTDLDLTTADGQKTLERRLVKAARKVCKMDEHGPNSLIPATSSRTCYRNATEKAQGQMAVVIENAEQYSRLGG